MTNLAIVSDIRLYREGLEKILGATENINVVAALDSYVEILKLLEENQLDVVLLDMRMINNDEILTAISTNYAKTKIIALAVPENDDNYLLCLESGIAGYLPKESSISELMEAVRTVNNGRMYCPASINQSILRSVKHLHDDYRSSDIHSSGTKAREALTPRENQIVQLLTRGMSNKKIAQTLTIELSTVKNHVHNILVKMGAENRSQIACLLQD